MPLGKRELEEAPPREPLTSLAAIVRDWQWRFPLQRRDTVVTFCSEAPTLPVAIDRAVASIRPDGKMHNHQTRVPRDARAELGRTLRANAKSIRADIRRVSRSGAVDPFDRLHEWVASCSGAGIGPVTTYDVATRIGAHPSLGCEPSSLYLHAGARAGWLALCPDPKRWRGEEKVLRSQMPVELQQLPADEIEDLCCTYRTVYDQLTDRGTWPQEAEGSHHV